VNSLLAHLIEELARGYDGWSARHPASLLDEAIVTRYEIVNVRSNGSRYDGRILWVDQFLVGTQFVAGRVWDYLWARAGKEAPKIMEPFWTFTVDSADQLSQDECRNDHPDLARVMQRD